jgi:hypothetical protein
MVNKEQFTEVLNNVKTSIVNELEEKLVSDINNSTITSVIENINKCNPVLNIEYGVSSCDDTSKLCIDYEVEGNININSELVCEPVIKSLSKNTLIGSLTRAPQNSIVYNGKLFFFGVKVNNTTNENNCVLVYDLVKNTYDYISMTYETYDTISCIRKDNIAYLQYNGYVYRFNLDTYENERWKKLRSNSWYSISDTALQILDDKLYILGGHSNSGVDWIQCIDLVNEEIINIDLLLPYSVSNAFSVVYNSCIYLFGGYSTHLQLTKRNSIIKYDPINNIIEDLNISLPGEIYYVRGILIDNKAYIFSDNTGKVHIFNMDTQQVEETYIVGALEAIIQNDDKVYCVLRSELCLFDINTNEVVHFEDTLCLSNAIVEPTFIMDGSKVYICAGNGATSFYDLIDLETLTKESFHLSGINQHYYLYGSQTFKINDKHYIIGGRYSKGVYEFDSITNKCTYLFALPKQNIESNSMVLIDNIVYIFGYKQYYSGSYSSGYSDYSQIIKIDVINNSYEIIDTELPRMNMRGVTFNSNIYLFSSEHIYTFDINSNTFNQLSMTLPIKISNYGIGLIDNNVYLVSGTNIQVFNLISNEIVVLNYELPAQYSRMGSVVYNNKLYLFGGMIAFESTYMGFANTYYINTSHILCLDVDTMLNKNNTLVLLSQDKNTFTLFNKDNINIKVGIENLYIGNFFNTINEVSHLAYLYKDGEWKSLKQLNSEGDV